jgi:hypothetical protein
MKKSKSPISLLAVSFAMAGSIREERHTGGEVEGEREEKEKEKEKEKKEKQKKRAGQEEGRW